MATSTIPKTLRGLCARRVGLLLTGLCLASASNSLQAEEERTLIKVEEDWEALITEADEDSCSPQIINVISPVQTLSGLYGMVELNHNSFPTFNEGGIQLQGRTGEDLNWARSFAYDRRLRHSYDRLQYTVGLRVLQEEYFDNADLLLIVKKVASKSWGNLNNDVMVLGLRMEDATLDDYSPEFSVASSSVHVGAHRVASMYMKECRRYYSNGDVETDTTVRYAKRYVEVEGAIMLDYYSSVLE